MTTAPSGQLFLQGWPVSCPKSCCKCIWAQKQADNILYSSSAKQPAWLARIAGTDKRDDPGIGPWTPAMFSPNCKTACPQGAASPQEPRPAKSDNHQGLSWKAHLMVVLVDNPSVLAPKIRHILASDLFLTAHQFTRAISRLVAVQRTLGCCSVKFMN